MLAYAIGSIAQEFQRKMTFNLINKKTLYNEPINTDTNLKQNHEIVILKQLLANFLSIFFPILLYYTNYNVCEFLTL